MMQVKQIILKMLEHEYISEFKIINGVSQHPRGQDFAEWLEYVYGLKSRCWACEVEAHEDCAHVAKDGQGMVVFCCCDADWDQD